MLSIPPCCCCCCCCCCCPPLCTDSFGAPPTGPGGVATRRGRLDEEDCCCFDGVLFPASASSNSRCKDFLGEAPEDGLKKWGKYQTSRFKYFFSSQFAYLAVLEELRFADALAEEGEGTLALDKEDVDDVIAAPAGDSLAEAEAVAELSLASNLLSSS